MRYKLLSALVFISCAANAQQINPVPDYVFQNRMSVGRTTVTDTSAYFSIGPRFGATRGMQPPMVNDTAAVTGTKRNGLLIFSMQRNKYAYWDSAASRWREFGAGSLTSITAGTGLTGGTITTSGTIAADTLTLSTRAWRQKGIDSVAGLARVTGSGTTNYVPKFTGSTALGNSQIFDNGTGIGIGTTSPINTLDVSGTFRSTGNTTIPGWIFRTTNVQEATDSSSYIIFRRTIDNNQNFAILPVTYQGLTALRMQNFGGSSSSIWLSNGRLSFAGGTTENMTLIGTELYVGHSGAPTDAGAYALQVAGSIYNTTGAVFAATSGNVGIGTTNPSERLHVSGKARITTIDSSSSPINLLWSNVDGVIQKTAVASVIGSGTAKYIPKFATATTFTNSLIYEDNNEVRINTTSDGGDWVLQVSGNTLISSGQLRVSANANAGMSLARSGTSEVYMETGNTSGGLKVGVAGSTGGSSQGFSGYAGFILTNPAYPLQFGSLDTMRMTLTTTGELLISTSTTDNGNYKLQVDGNVWSTGSLTTGDPTSGTKKPWKLGSKVAASVQLDTANYVEVEIDGVFVRLAIVTPL